MEENKYEKATFAAGCFWGVEHAFRMLDGVTDAICGYSGGDKENPTYEEVCSGSTGHAESVEVTYDPGQVGYEKLLEAFWNMHNPTTKNRQGPDIGTQYRSVIFYHTPQQKKLAEGSKKALDDSGKYQVPVVTEIVEAKPFYKAEEYHQMYYKKHGLTSCPY